MHGMLAKLASQAKHAQDTSLACGRREVWEQVGLGAQDEQELAECHEQAVQHFDACETHFTEEVAARSSHLFEAAGVVGDLRACLGGCFDLVHGMRSEVQKLHVQSSGGCQSFVLSNLTCTRETVHPAASGQLMHAKPCVQCFCSIDRLPKLDKNAVHVSHARALPGPMAMSICLGVQRIVYAHRYRR